MNCKEQDLEIAAVKLEFSNRNLIVFCVYRAPTGDMDYFLKHIDIILNTLHNPKTDFVLCGDLNINYTGTNNKKTRLDNLLSTYNLIGTVHFPTRITSIATTSIDNIFIDRGSNYTIKPHINGLSDHDTQILILENLTNTISFHETIYTRNINKSTMAEFQSLLSWELWKDVFGINDVNTMFNNFLNTYFRCFYTCFAKRQTSKSNQSKNGWITKGTKVSCRRKKELYVLCRTHKDYDLKLYYKKYCAILTTVIRNAKKLHYNNIILRANNKMKTTWKIINREKGTNQHDKSVSSLTIDETTISNQDIIANMFNNYFSSVADYKF
jgi:hypothetical protein